ncbi:MAG: hypothetical protein V1758_05140 [Pseudomonadota bacterium]
MPWIKHWRIARSWLQGIGDTEVTQEEASLFAGEIQIELKERGLDKEKMGIVGFDEAGRAALRSKGIHLVDGAQLILEASKTKTQDEINCLKTADAVNAFDQASRWGYKDEAEVLTIEIAHGIGLVSVGAPAAANYNFPVINRPWSLRHPQPFEEGMVIAYESAEGEHRVGGVRNESMVVITKNDAEIMDYYPREEILVI